MLREENAAVRSQIDTASGEVTRATETASQLASAADSVHGVDAESESR